MDTLTATASFIAIGSVLWSWYRNTQKPLIVDRVVIHQKLYESTYILIIKNRKPYPVQINSASCFSKKSYLVRKVADHNPSYSSILNMAFCKFSSKETLEIGANGHTEMRIKGNVLKEPLERMLFSLKTSHGYHELWCKNILTVDMSGNTSVYTLDYDYEYHNKFKANIRYYWLKTIHALKMK